MFLCTYLNASWDCYGPYLITLFLDMSIFMIMRIPFHSHMDLYLNFYLLLYLLLYVLCSKCEGKIRCAPFILFMPILEIWKLWLSESISIFSFFYCCSSTVFCLLPPPLPTTPAIPTSYPCFHPLPLVIVHVKLFLIMLEEKSRSPEFDSYALSVKQYCCPTS